jgi:hypothetical protein
MGLMAPHTEKEEAVVEEALQMALAQVAMEAMVVIVVGVAVAVEQEQQQAVMGVMAVMVVQ